MSDPALSKTIETSRPTAQELWQRYHQQADTHTENALIEQYLPLVHSTLGRLAVTLPDHADKDDLNSAGMIGLLQALRNYNPSCGTPFDAYARLRIRGAMFDELRRMDWVPRRIREHAHEVRDALFALEQKLGRAPTDAEMATAMKLTLSEYTELLNEIRPASFVCLNIIGTAEGGEAIGSYGELLGSPDEENPLDKVSHRELSQLILAQLKKLPENQRKVMALFYIEELSLSEIAQIFEVTEGRICQIRAKAITALRTYLQRYEMEAA